MSKGFIFVYLTFLLTFSVLVYFVVLHRRQTLFTPQAQEAIISTTSQWRTKHLSPCDSSITGDPSIGNNWTKITFHCPGGVKNSTLALTVLDQKSWRNIVTEFARIIGFSPAAVIDGSDWTCYLDHKVLIDGQTIINWDSEAPQKSSIDCISPEHDLNYLVSYYGNK